MAGLCAPLPTLHPRPCGRRRTAWGRCGSLLLHRSGLAPPTPCRSPGAHPSYALVSPRHDYPPQKREGEERGYFFATFPGAAFFFPPPFPSLSSASRTRLNSCSDALSALGNRKFSDSSVLTIAEPITTRANHL